MDNPDHYSSAQSHPNQQNNAQPEQKPFAFTLNQSIQNVNINNNISM